MFPRQARKASFAGGVRAISIFGRSPSVAKARQAIPSLAGVRLHEYPETRGEPGMGWLDAQASGVEKGLAVTSICEESNFNHVIALGNGTNDVGMLTAASLAIAPADASPEAQAVATLVLDQGSEGGAFAEAVADRLPELLTTPVA
jgi:hydroxymethylpyrimidine pyrophosphatase-like HAD family hydrolase